MISKRVSLIAEEEMFKKQFDYLARQVMSCWQRGCNNSILAGSSVPGFIAAPVEMGRIITHCYHSIYSLRF